METTRSAVARRRQGYQHDIEIRDHRLVADEPEDEGGDDAGPRPTELLAASLASCTAITIEMYADRKGWDLGTVEVTVEYEPASTERASQLRRDDPDTARGGAHRRAAQADPGDRRQVPRPSRTHWPQDVEMTDSLKMFEE